MDANGMIAVSVVAFARIPLARIALYQRMMKFIVSILYVDALGDLYPTNENDDDDAAAAADD